MVLSMNKENAIEVNNITKSFKVYYDKGSELKEKMLFWKRNKYEMRQVLKGISFNVKNASNNVCFIKEIVLEKCILKPINGTNFCVEGKEEFTVVLNNLSVDQLVYLAKGHIYMRILDIQGTEYSFLIKTADNQILSIEKIACSCAY